MKNPTSGPWVSGFALAAVLLGVPSARPANATDTVSREACSTSIEDRDVADSLQTLRPTFRLLADDYDQKANEYAKEAERDRKFVSTDDLFGAGAYGRRYAAIFFADEASALEAKATESRALAARYRKLAVAEDAKSGC